VQLLLLKKRSHHTCLFIGIRERAKGERERECVQESEEKESCNGSSLAAIAAAASAARELMS
jgi:hypothetical protein